AHSERQEMREHRHEVLAQLPPDKAKLFEDAMKQVHEKNKATADQVRKLHEEQNAILTADKFDKNAWLAKEAQLDKLYDQMRATRRDAFVSVASQFSPSDRKIIAQLHEGPMPGEHGGHHDHGAM